MMQKPAVFRVESTGSHVEQSRAVDAAVARALQEERPLEAGHAPVLSAFTPAAEGGQEPDSSESAGYGWGV
ncbi:MAG: hypothetical protein IT186_03920 [Acidobacteria bacterium]|nr:hypothetical protein [Acidobacteriota bacterium]MCK6685039.1 hypothetical protein [Thermoanaerobaculia bacterium]